MRTPVDELSASIRREGVTAIKRLVENKIAEQHFVDFKVTQVDDYTDRTSLAPNDLKNLAKGISGFGNSEGGIIVWGIDDSINDQASELKPIKQIDVFNALVNRHISRVTIPHHNRVENIIIREPAEPDSGYLVTVIPRYDGLPLQVIQGNIFYIRAGESFVPIPHAVLAGLFGRKPAPNVFVMYTVNTPRFSADEFVKFSVGVQLVNDGKGFAEDLFINQSIFLPGGPTGAEFGGPVDDRFEGDRIFGVAINLRSKTMKLAPEQRCQPFVVDFKIKPPFEKDFIMEILVGAQGQMPYRTKYKHTPKELQIMYNQFKKNQTSYDFMKDFLPIKEKEEVK